jgi:hypothetical protein
MSYSSMSKGYLTQARFREMDVLLCTAVPLVITAMSVTVLYIVSAAILRDIIFKSCLRFGYICISFFFNIYISSSITEFE